jgi:hypothetical protein
MPAFSRKWIIPFGLLVIVAAAYCFAARQEPRLTPIQEMEAVIEPYELKYGAETNVRDRFVVSAEQREIHVRPSWVRVEIKKDGGMSINGITAWNVSVFGWSPALQTALLNALNDSPATAQQLVEHPDERIQFLLLKVLYDWGRNVKAMTDPDDVEKRRPWSLKPHAVEALLSLARRNDPHAVGTVISALKFKGKFSTDVFLFGMAHNSSGIRAEALSWLNPERQQLTSAELQAVAPVLIDHLTDRDLVVREWSLLGLQSLVAYWEQSLGGASFDLVRSDQEQMIKLPIAPASNRWHRDVFPQTSELAKEYQAEWNAWLTKAEQSL